MMPASKHSRWLLALSALMVVAIPGFVEGFYGRTAYLADWVSYLNVSQAVSHHDWKNIFDPMWNPGYPALVALARSFAPHTPEGEWYAIFVLNCILYLMAWMAALRLLREVRSWSSPVSGDAIPSSPAVLWIVCAAFLCCELAFDRVSRVAPDLLVTILFLLAASQLLRVLRQPTAGSAAVLGLILGIGYWVKSVFSAYAFVVLLLLLSGIVARRAPRRTFAIALAAFLVLAIPYICAISWSYGQFTLGASGALNYDFHINHLPHWTNWQGGPAQFGYPIHHTTRLIPGQPVFGFGGPFISTYPPYNNLAWWYRGYHHFFSLRNQIAGTARACFFAWVILRAHWFLMALLFVYLAIAVRPVWRRTALRSLRIFWPLALLPLLAGCTYLMVHIEDRYLAGIIFMLSLLPLTLLLDPEIRSRGTLLRLLLVLYTIGAAADLAHNDMAALRAAIHRDNFHQDREWRIADGLRADGFRPGDRIALIGHNDPSFRCGWAYTARVRIVAEYGSLPWSLAPWDRTRFDRSQHETADQDWGDAFWKLPPFERGAIVAAFRGTGAKAVVSLAPPAAGASGWRVLPGNDAWVYLFH